jgi:hypothetical protein
MYEGIALSSGAFSYLWHWLQALISVYPTTVVGGKSIVSGSAEHGVLAPENVYDLNQVRTKRKIRIRR